MLFLAPLLPLLALASEAAAAPAAAAPEVVGRGDISRRIILPRLSTASSTVLPSSSLAEVTQWALFSRAAYCGTNGVFPSTWTCGPACNALKGVTVIATGGNDDTIPSWYVAYSSVLKTIIVAHQGTNPDSFVSVLGNAVFVPAPLSTKFFPGAAAAGAQAHSGFQITHSLTADAILAAVKTASTTYDTTKIVTVGHSLGAALASLDALMFKLTLPNFTVSARTLAIPRVGNSDFVDFFSAKVPDQTHISNQQDPVPRLPGTFLGFEQLPGEIWINDAGVYNVCPGTENLNCALGVSPLKFDLGDHTGPYGGIKMGRENCP